MYKPPLFAAFGAVPRRLSLLCLLLCGCEKSEQISVYTVPRHETLQSTEFIEKNQLAHPKPERMIGVVIPRKSSLWYFKLQGNIEAVAARENDLREFLKSVRFTEDDKIDWALPTGWEQLPGSGLRYATLVLARETKLEMSVSTFPSQSDLTSTDQVVQNINRWRRQLSLPPIEEEDLDRQAEKLELGGEAGYWVNIIGRPSPKPVGMGPPPQQAPQAQQEKRAEPATEPSRPTYDKPAEWFEGPPAMFASVSLQVQERDAKAAITVTQARGDRIDNVNRWRGQLGLEPLTASELTSTAKKVQVGEGTGELYEMTASGRTIFGVIIEDRGQMWFVKLVGEAALAERERPRFEAFLKSLRLG